MKREIFSLFLNIIFLRDEMNFFKVKTIKGLAKLQVERLEKQNSKKIPFYSV
jgi:hypothetical protein